MAEKNPHTQRLNLIVSPELEKRIEDYKFDCRLPSQQAALRELLTTALDAYDRQKAKQRP